MQIAYASERGVGSANEDYAVCGANWAVVLDGATAFPGVESGCIHDVPWLVHRLAAALAVRMLGDAAPLEDILASAIEEVRGQHIEECDLDNPDSPSSTVSMARVSGARLDYLILADSPIALWHPEKGTRVFEDERIANLPGGRPYTRELVRSCRNSPGGFWVASTDPAAAYHSVRGSVDLDPGTEIALFTDGVTRLIEFYQHTWDSLFSLLRRMQPAGVIASVREAEIKEAPLYGKRHDDATVAHVTSIVSEPD
jgi:protein phosphatase 2C-like protein